jgi:single-strand DNA-binding protein
MASSFNKVILLGNVTRDIAVKYTPNGTAVCEIGIAVSESYLDKKTNQRRENTTFVDVTLWGRTAEVAGEYLAKGRPVLIEGRLNLDTWTDKESGQKRSKLKVVGEKLTLLGGGKKSESRESSSEPGAESPDMGGSPPPDDEVPF